MTVNRDATWTLWATHSWEDVTKLIDTVHSHLLTQHKTVWNERKYGMRKMSRSRCDEVKYSGDEEIDERQIENELVGAMKPDAEVDESEYFEDEDYFQLEFTEQLFHDRIQ